MNKLIVIGNLTKDPETRVTQSGKTVCSFDVAVNERRGGQDSTAYFRVSAWEKQGENCQSYLSKGKKVFVAGPVSARAYTTGSGETRVRVEIMANEVEFLSPANNAAAPAYSAPAALPAQMTPVETEELPF